MLHLEIALPWHSSLALSLDARSCISGDWMLARVSLGLAHGAQLCSHGVHYQSLLTRVWRFHVHTLAVNLVRALPTSRTRTHGHALTSLWPIPKPSLCPLPGDTAWTDSPHAMTLRPYRPVFSYFSKCFLYSSPLPSNNVGRVEWIKVRELTCVCKVKHWARAVTRLNRMVVDYTQFSVKTKS